jgi:hypothetical protein
MYPDGGGLYLQATMGADKTPRRSWLFRFAMNGRERQMGLGRAQDVSLADARDAASAARELRREGKDPIVERAVIRSQASMAAARTVTFDECARGYIAAITSVVACSRCANGD